MKNLTWEKDGQWGIEGVELSALPPQVYAALWKLSKLEHDKNAALVQLARILGIDLKAKIEEIEALLAKKPEGG